MVGGQNVVQRQFGRARIGKNPLHSAAGQQLHLAGAHLERITDVLAARPEQALGAPRLRPDLHGRIELDDVSFRYDPNAPLVLRGVSASIEPGQKVALVGRTGSGKRT